MTGQEFEGLSAGISENLRLSVSKRAIQPCHVLLAKEVPEADDGILRVLHELVLGLVSDVLRKVSASTNCISQRDAPFPRPGTQWHKQSVVHHLRWQCSQRFLPVKHPVSLEQ